MRGLLVLLLITVAPTPSVADWQYTRWGMSIDDLIAAGNGAVSRTTEQEANTQRMEGKLGRPIAKANYHTKEFAFTAYFFMPKNELVAVRLVGNPDRFFEIKNQLEQVYGKPIEKRETSILAQCKLYSTKWRDDTGKNVVHFSGVHCQPTDKKLGSVAILYEPTLSKDQSGL